MGQSDVLRLVVTLTHFHWNKGVQLSFFQCGFASRQVGRDTVSRAFAVCGKEEKKEGKCAQSSFYRS